MKKHLHSFFPFIIGGVFILCNIPAYSQVVINEVSSNNESYFPDEDGDYNDWIELYNPDSSPVNLAGYKLSDNATLPAKWTFPNAVIAPKGYLTVHASGKNRGIDHWESIVKEGDIWKYKVPSAAIPGWNAQGFNDATWSGGPGGFGYGDGDDSTVLPAGTVSVYLRKTFNVIDSSVISAMVLSMDCDDGFAAYLNGVEIARSHIGASPAYNAVADSDNEAVMYSGGTPASYTINYATFKSLLRNGPNVLAIEVHNLSGTSSDLTARPFLHVGIANNSTNYQALPSWFTSSGNQVLHTNFSLKSSGGETVLLSNPAGTVVSSVTLPALQPDNTYGRFPNGSATLKVLLPPTPNASNGSASSFSGYLDATVSFSVPAGFYSSTQTVSCSCSDPTAQILYTTNGDKPTNGGSLYTGPLTVNTTRVLRAMCYKAGYISRSIETNTYFINDPGATVPVVSISTRPNYYFSADSGIYVLGNNYDGSPPHYGANFWQDWEREIHFEYFDKTKSFRLEQDCGVKIFGGFSRDYGMKSMRLIPDEKYGKNKITFPFFSEKPSVTEFTGIHLRDGGNDLHYAHLRDQLNHRVLQSMPQVQGSQTHLDFSAYEPVVVFINGQYWGVHHLRERYNTGYLEANHGVSDFELLEMDGDVIKAQNSDHFMNMVNFIKANDMTLAANYAQVKQWLDIENYVDYIAAETYHTNWDWPHNNIKYWRPKTPTGKWRYLYYDTDFSCNLYGNSPASTNELADVIEPTSARNSLRIGNIHSPMLKKLLTNIEFRNYFVNRYADLINTIYQPSNYKAVFNKLKTELSPEMSRHIGKWPETAGSVSGWDGECNAIASFIDGRPGYARDYIQKQFSLTGQVNVTLNVNPAGAGLVKINTIIPNTLPWTGVYFNGVPVTITVVPNPGYTFVNWSSSAITLSDPTSKSFTLNVTGNNTFTANFVASGNVPKIVFNEINYNPDSSYNSGGWVELYNYGTAAQDLSGWIFRDEKDYHGFVIPAGTVLGAGQYLVLVRDSAKFKALYPTVTNYVGEIGFDLSNSGETLRLFDNFNRLYLAVKYNDKAPWPLYADGKGSTLELKDPTKDLNDPASWFDGCRGGSPGTAYVPCPCTAVDLGPDRIICTSSAGGAYTLNTGLTPHPDRRFNWYFNGTLLTGVNTPTLNVSTGGDYSVIVDSVGCIKSDEVHLTTDLSFSLGADVMLCTPAVTTLDSRLPAKGITYTWKRNNTVLSGKDTPSISVSAAGTYVLLVNATGCTQKSDTVVIGSGTATPVDGSRCGPGTVALSVTGPGSYEWYAAPAGGSAIATGATYSPNVSATTTYYVKDASQISGTVGPANIDAIVGASGKTWYNQDFNTQDYKLIFDVLKPLYLLGVTVYTDGPQNVTVRVLNPDKTVKFTKTVPVSSAGMNRIPLGFQFTTADVKNGYYLDMVGTTGQLKMNGDGCVPVYPYTSQGYIRITKTTPDWAGGNNGWYFYAYNWEWSTSPYGTCDRVPVEAKVNNAPGAAGPISGSNNVCSGVTGTYSIAPVANASGYTWTVPDGTTITSGAGTNSITVTFGSVSGNITVTPFSPCGNGAAQSLNVVVVPAGATASVTASASSTSVCTGQTVTLTATTLTGGATPQYQWSKNGFPVAGETGTTYTPASVSNGDVFYVVMTSSSTCVVGSPATSNSVTVKVSDPVTPAVALAASSTEICSGTSVTFTATPSNGGTTPSYQWKKNGSVISGAGATLVTSSLADGDVISVTMTSGAVCPTVNPVTSDPVAMKVNTAVPAGVTVAAASSYFCAGKPATFTATPANGGSAPAYQWKVNGTNAGSGSNTFTSSTLKNGDTVTVTMTSSLMCATGSPVTSAPLAVTIYPNVPASVNITASSNSVCTGQEVVFNATPANGGATPSYQWKINGVNAGTNSSTFSSSTLADGDAVWVVMTSNAACVTGSPAISNSQPIRVTQYVPVTVAIEASSSTICAGQSASFTATPENGGTAPVYQWKVNGANAGTDSETFTSSSLADGDVVSVAMTSSLACVTGSPASSNNITMKVNPALPASVNIQAEATAICAGQPASFTAVPVNGGTNPSYQWKINGKNAGTNSNTFSTSALADKDTVTVLMTSTATCATGSPATSVPVVMTVSPTPAASVTIEADAATVCAGVPVHFTATGQYGGSAPAYQWKVNGINAGTNSDIFTSSSLADGDVVTVVMTSNEACVTGSPAVSNGVTMKVNPNLTASVTVSTDATTVCSGAMTEFRANPVNGGDTPVYQWKINGQNAGTNSSVFNTSVLNDGDAVTVEMTSSAVCSGDAPVASDALIMKVSPTQPASVTVNAGSASVCAGQPATFTAVPVNGGTSPSYQWKVNGVNAGTNAPTFTSSAMADGDAVTVAMTSSAACITGSPATSAPVKVTVQPVPVATVTAGGATEFCQGGSVTLSASAAAGYAYQWNKDGLAIEGATAASYDAGASGDYTVEVTASGCTGVSGAIKVKSVTPPTTANAGTDQTVCSDNAVLAANTPAEGSGTWTRISGSGIVSDPSDPHSPVSGLGSGDNVFQWTVSNGTTCAASSDQVIITVGASGAASVTIAPGANPACEGIPVTFVASPVNGGPAPEFQWQVNGVNVGTGENTFVSAFNNGDEVSVVMTSALACATGSPATSNVVTMTVNSSSTASVEITTGATSVCEGAPVTFHAAPLHGGTSPVYRWKINGVVAGTGSDAFTTSRLKDQDQVSLEMTSSEQCVINSPVTSNVLTMSVQPSGPASVAISADRTEVCSGETVIFSAIAQNGGNNPSYQWKVNGVNAGTNSATFTASGLVNGDKVSVEMTSGSSCATGSPAASNEVAVKVTPSVPASVNVSASATAICAGQTVNFTASPVNGGTAPVYQWKVNGQNVGANNKTFASSSLADGDMVTVEMTSSQACAGESPATSLPLTMTVSPSAPASVSVQADVTEVCAGQSVTFTATAVNGGDAPSYQWEVNGIKSGTNSDTYTTGSLSDQDKVRVIMTSSAACATGSPATSPAVTINVHPAVTASVQIDPPKPVVCPGESMTLTALPSNGGDNPVFQWKVNDVPSGTGSGFTSSAWANGDIVSVEMVSDAACVRNTPAASGPVTVSVASSAAASVSVKADRDSVCEGGSVTFTATPVNGGNYPAYQWKVGGADVGANADVFTTSSLAPGDEVTVVMTSGLKCAPGSPAVSDPVTVRVDKHPTTANAGPDQNITNTVTYLEGNDPVVGQGRWTQLSGTGFISNPERWNSNVGGLSRGENSYRWTITNGSCPSSFDDVTVNVGVIPPFVISGPDTIVAGNTYTFTVPNEPGVTYIWTVPGGASIISGNGTNSITVTFNRDISGTIYVTKITASGSVTTSKDVSTVTAVVAGTSGTDTYFLFPNPYISTTRFIIHSPLQEQLLLKIVDMKGIVVSENTNYRTNEEIILGSDLAAGMYNVTAVYKDRIVQFKMYKAE